MHIMMLASENDALDGCKVGGLADVVRDVPPALARQGCRVTVVVPAYNFLHRLPGARQIHEYSVYFRGYPYYINVYEVPGKRPHPGVTQLVLHHPDLWATGPNQLYVHDPDDRPFATDANRFALFCQAAAGLILTRFADDIDCLHLHDWPAALMMVLREYHWGYEPLKAIRTVLTVHNLGMQGVRPLRGHDSSLEAWFPLMSYDWFAVSDRRWPDLINPMAAAVRMADAVHVVSPTYAEEILKPNRPPVFYGGEGIESDLGYAAGEGRLFGILNGCEYPEDRVPPKMAFADMLRVCRSALIPWTGDAAAVAAAHFIAHARLTERIDAPKPPRLLLTAVSRVVEQKMLLLIAHGSNGRAGLQNLLDALDKDDLFILLGFGDYNYDQFFKWMSARNPNFIFLNGYSGRIAELLYANGDLFVMPSSFEPCGISQMLAMRDGQPCLVHRVGGLRDTVADGVNGFAFQGDSLHEQVDNMVMAAKTAVDIAVNDPDRWRGIRNSAANARFLWENTVRLYIEELYR